MTQQTVTPIPDRQVVSDVIDQFEIFQDPKGRLFAMLKPAPSADKSSKPSDPYAYPLNDEAFVRVIRDMMRERLGRVVARQTIADAVQVLRHAAGTKARSNRHFVATIGSLRFRVQTSPPSISQKSEHGDLGPDRSKQLFEPVADRMWTLQGKGGQVVRIGRAVTLDEPGALLKDYAAAPIAPASPRLMPLVTNVLDALAAGDRFWETRTKPLEGLVATLEKAFPQLNPKQVHLVAGWLLGVVTDAPMPMLLITGRAASGKSVLAQTIADLFSVTGEPNRSLPLTIGALQAAMVADPVVLFDNVRALPRAISDEFCRLLTGGNLPNFRSSFPAYGHHSSARVVMTAIANPIAAEDLASRALVIEIGDGHDRCFLEQGRPSATTIREIALDLIAAISRTIVGKHSKTQLSANVAASSPVASVSVAANIKGAKPVAYRFGQFWTHVKDCGNYAGVPDLETAIQDNRKDIDIANAEDDPLVIAIRLFLSKRTEDKRWSGSAGELATELAEIKDNARYLEPAWLRNPRSLSVALAHRAHTLAAANVSYSRTGQREHCLHFINPALETMASAAKERPEEEDKQNAPVAHEKNEDHARPVGQAA